MTATVRYGLTSLGLGGIAFWGSENLFWAAPVKGIDIFDLLLTWLMYALCCAAALSAAIFSGLAGWKALFLSGAILGWCVEGAIVSTAYDAFPAQLVWTPLAWHALITALAVFGLCRAGPHWRLASQIAALLAVAVAIAFFAQYWPLERKVMPAPELTLLYLAGFGLLVPLANAALDRLGDVPAPRPRVLWIAPALVVSIWAIQTALAPSFVRLAGPLLVMVTFLAMKRLARSEHASLSFGSPAPLWRHAVFMILPIATTLLCIFGWDSWRGMESNVPFALVTGLVGLGLWLWLMVEALIAVWKARRKSHGPEPHAR